MEVFIGLACIEERQPLLISSQVKRENIFGIKDELRVASYRITGIRGPLGPASPKPNPLTVLMTADIEIFIKRQFFAENSLAYPKRPLTIKVVSPIGKYHPESSNPFIKALLPPSPAKVKVAEFLEPLEGSI